MCLSSASDTEKPETEDEILDIKCEVLEDLRTLIWRDGFPSSTASMENAVERMETGLDLLF